VQVIIGLSVSQLKEECEKIVSAKPAMQETHSLVLDSTT